MPARGGPSVRIGLIVGGHGHLPIGLALVVFFLANRASLTEFLDPLQTQQGVVPLLPRTGYRR